MSLVQTQSLRKKIDTLIAESVEQIGPKNRLRDACEYALTNGGKRFRPALVLLVAKALGDQDARKAALAVEYFHTASLIADDLPCMDNDQERRGHPTLHVAFDEETALLASYALIASGYGFLAHESETTSYALENVSYNTGLLGATGGQYLDIIPPNLTEETLDDVIQKKTGSLFEISFVLGWLYGGGDVNLLDTVKQTSFHFGMAFQIADDIGDQAQDKANERLINVANVLGVDRALGKLKEHVAACQTLLDKLQLHSPVLNQLLLDLL